MKKQEAEKKYGKEMLEKMVKTEYLNNITITMNKDGTTDIPERDYELAYRAVKGKYISSLEWD